MDAIDPLDSDIAPVEHVSRWPAFTAFLVAWCMPATCARRLTRLPLVRAFAVHLVAAILAALAIVFFIAFAADRGPLVSFLTFAPFADALDTLAAGFLRRPRKAPFALVSTPVFVGLVFLVVALLSPPWGTGFLR